MNLVRIFFTSILLGWIICPLYSAEKHIVQVVGNISAAIPDAAGHQTPLLEFLRRYERIVRQVGRLENSAAASDLRLELTAPGEQTLAPDKFTLQRKTAVLTLPADYRSWLNDPVLGRRLSSAVLQSRLGNPPLQPLPEPLLWIADGLWAEFVQRERAGQRILRFTWLPGLRNVAELGDDIYLSSQTLQAPPGIRPGSAEWTLYCERAQLMLEVARSLGSSNRNYPIKDYCFLIMGGKLPAPECFVKSFGAAARKRMMPGSWQSDRKVTEAQLSYKALSLLAMRSLFSNYVPMSAAGIRKRLEPIKQVNYTHSRGSFEMQAALSDLPELVEKYDSCLNLPRIKLQQFNELAAIAPLQLRSDIFNLATLLSDISLRPAAALKDGIKSSLQLLEAKISKLEQVEKLLIRHEKERTPLLYEYRFSLEGSAPPAVLPGKVKKFLDEAEQNYQQKY